MELEPRGLDLVLASRDVLLSLRLCRRRVVVR